MQAGLPRPQPYEDVSSEEPLGRVTFASTGQGRDFHTVLRDRDGIVFGVLFAAAGVAPAEVRATGQAIVEQLQELNQLKIARELDDERGTMGDRALQILDDMRQQRLETTVWRGLFRKPDKVFTLPAAIWKRIADLLWERMQRT